MFLHNDLGGGLDEVIVVLTSSKPRLIIPYFYFYFYFHFITFKAH